MARCNNEYAYVMALPDKATKLLLELVAASAVPQGEQKKKDVGDVGLHLTLMKVPLRILPRTVTTIEYMLPKPFSVAVNGNSLLPGKDGGKMYTVLTVESEPCHRLCASFGSQF